MVIFIFSLNLFLRHKRFYVYLSCAVEHVCVYCYSAGLAGWFFVRFCFCRHVIKYSGLSYLVKLWTSWVRLCVVFVCRILVNHNKCWQFSEPIISRNNREVWRHDTMVAKCLFLNNPLDRDSHLHCRVVLFLSAIMHRKVILVSFFVLFLPYLQDRGLLMLPHGNVT